MMVFTTWGGEGLPLGQSFLILREYIKVKESPPILYTSSQLAHTQFHLTKLSTLNTSDFYNSSTLTKNTYLTRNIQFECTS